MIGRFNGWKLPPSPLIGDEAVGFDDSSWEKVALPPTAYLEPLVITNPWQDVVLDVYRDKLKGRKDVHVR